MNSSTVSACLNRNAERMPIDGYVILDSLLHADEVDRVRESMTDVDVDGVGDRRFLDREWCRLLGHVIRHRMLKARLLYRASQPVLCTGLDENEEAVNGVGLRRELHVPLAARCDGPHLSDWSLKQDIPHARASSELLATMLVVRVPIDDRGSEGGALCVVPGSHSTADVEAAAIECPLAAGSAIAFSPMLLHGLHVSTAGKPRRALQFLFGPQDLPDGARWYYPA